MDLDRYFSKDNTNSQYGYEKMLNISNQQKKVNQKYNEILSHTHEDGQYQKTENSVGKNAEKLEPCTWLAGMLNSAATMKNTIEAPQKIKNRIPI